MLIYYVIEKADWSIKWDGTYVSQSLRELRLAEVNIITEFDSIKKSILHFGSRNLYLPSNWKEIHSSNKVIFTWFHGLASDMSPLNQAMIKSLPKASKKAAFVHTSCTTAKARLINWGVEQNKIVVIPLGVDIVHFKPLADNEEKKLVRKEIGILENKICIGSFQKDGNGWEEGNEPKLIKGPDIFCDTIIKLSKRYPLHILLTGPARGFVKDRLSKAGVPFTHIYLKNYLDIVKYYQSLDIYLITSREEGGPKALLESMATGIPVVSTRAGMAVDIILHRGNGLLAEVEDSEQLLECLIQLIEDSDLYKKVVQKGLNTIKNYDWKTIASRYYKELYLPFLNL